MSAGDLEAGKVETDDIVVRTLQERDLDAIVRIDASDTGRSRREYYRDRVTASLTNSRLCTSLVAEVSGAVVGFLMATTYYGEFGVIDPTSVIDAFAVHKDFRRRKVGAALLGQFVMNARALGLVKLRTEVAWNDVDMLAFFDKNGFSLAGRVVLEREIA